MLIELSGLPGSGKSTFAKQIAGTSGLPIISVSGKFPIVYWNLRYLIRHPVLFFRFLFIVLRNLAPEGMQYEKFVNLFLVANAKYAKAESLGGGIIDQGHYQSVVSLFETNILTEGLNSFAKSLPTPHRLLFFAYPKNIRDARMTERGYGTREALTADYVQKWAEVSVMNVSEFIDYAKEDPRIPLVPLVDDSELGEIERQMQSQSHLVYVLDGRLPTEKAHGNQVASMCEALGDSGVRIDLWYAYRNDEHPIRESIFSYYGVSPKFTARMLKNVDFSFLPPKLRFYANRLFFIFEILRQPWPKGAICFTRKPEIVWLMKLRGIKVIYECHDWFGNAASTQLFLLRGVDCVITTNRFIKEQFVQSGVGDDIIHVMPNGVDLRCFDIPETKEEAREKIWKLYEMPEEWKNKKVLLYTGSFTTMRVDKGINDILLALEQIPDEDVVFVAVGGDTMDISTYEAKYRALKLDTRVKLFGRTTKNILALWQKAADALLMPFPRKAHYEFFMSPLKTFEYMASGRPIIASDLPSIREILSDETAFFVPPDNPEELAKGIRRILKDTTSGEARAKSARQKVSKWTWWERAKKIADIINII